MIAVDVGGTFTDFVTVDEKGDITASKVPTDLEISGNSVIEGLKGLEIPKHSILNHASTHGLNAILERRIPKVGFLTTEGHRDILDFARAWKPMDAMTDAHWRRSGGDSGKPLIERYLRRGIRERITSSGDVLIPLDRNQARREIEVLKRCNVKGVAVCLINSYVNPNHEKMLRDLIEEILGDAPVSVSSEISPLGREYPRASTTVIDLIMKIIYGDYMRQMHGRLQDIGFKGELNLADSAATLIPHDYAMERPSRIMYSGPAAGAKGSTYFGRLINETNIICCDIGGTSADISIIKDGRPLIKTEYEIEHDLIVNTLAIEITSIGQGGGSIVNIGPHGELRVGPEGAGAKPGPACYGMGGMQPTVTDAFLLIRILDENRFLGGKKRLFPVLAEKAFKDLIRKSDIGDLIRQTYELTLANIAEGIASVTVERGIDLRDFSLFAYGSAGPMILPQTMNSLNIRRVIVPPHPGNFSALGLASTDLTYTDSRSAYLILDPDDNNISERINSIFAMMEENLLKRIPQKFKNKDFRFVRTFDGYYAGQTWETPFVHVPSEEITKKSIQSMIQSFHERYLELWGNSFAHLPVVACSYRTMCVLPIQKLTYKEIPERKSGRPQAVTRDLAHLPDMSPVFEFNRDNLLRGDVVEGPAIIREPVSTTVVCPGQIARIGRFGEIRIERE